MGWSNWGWKTKVAAVAAGAVGVLAAGVAIGALAFTPGGQAVAGFLGYLVSTQLGFGLVVGGTTAAVVGTAGVAAGRYSKTVDGADVGESSTDEPDKDEGKDVDEPELTPEQQRIAKLEAKVAELTERGTATPAAAAAPKRTAGRTAENRAERLLATLLEPDNASHADRFASRGGQDHSGGRG